MKSLNDVEQAIMRLHFTTPAAMDKHIITDALTVLEGFVSAGSLASKATVWQKIVKSRITKLVAAAVIVIGILTGAAYMLVRGGFEPIAVRPEPSREATERKVAKHGIDQGPAEKQKQAVIAEPPRIVNPELAIARTDRNILARISHRAVKRIDSERIDAEAKMIEEIAAAGDIGGLVKMLSGGLYESKVLAAEHLGEIGDKTALPKLKELNKRHGGWLFGNKCVSAYYEGSRTSGAFAVAICKIVTRDLAPAEQIEAWFGLLEGRGPVMPTVDELFELNGAGPVIRAKGRDMAKENPNEKFTSGFDIGLRVGEELSKFDDPSIVVRLRQTDNKGAAIYAVWMEVRDMETKQAIERCMEIARNEGGAQQYGAIKCLSTLGDGAIDALDKLALEGHAEAISTFDSFGDNPEVLEILCWHLTNNKNPQVRLKVILPELLEPVHTWRFRQPSFMQGLVTALYDPNKDVRVRAAGLLRNAAYEENGSQLLDYEEDLLIALKHPDKDVLPYIAQALNRLGSKRLNEKVPDPPEIRTDIDERSESPMLPTR